MKEALKTGTTTVGIICKDGVVLAADRRATAGHLLADKDVVKVVPVSSHMAVTTAGSVSEIQLMVRLIRAEIKLKEIQTGRKMRVIEAAHLVASMCYNAIRRPSMIMAIAAFLLGGVDEDGPFLYEIEPAGSAMEKKDYAADGSGMVFAIPILDADYKKGMSIDEGVELAKKAINASHKRDTASGNGILVLAITKDGVEEKFKQEVEIGLY